MRKQLLFNRLADGKMKIVNSSGCKVATVMVKKNGSRLRGIRNQQLCSMRRVSDSSRKPLPTALPVSNIGPENLDME